MILNRKVGSNKGRARVWLEGAYLTSAGWHRGVRFDLTMSPGLIVITRNEVDGARKVCGKKHPIIDVCNADVARYLPGATRARIVVTGPFITIMDGSEVT